MSPGPPPVPGGRSEEERERARLEREARRREAPSRDERQVDKGGGRWGRKPRKEQAPATPAPPQAPATPAPPDTPTMSWPAPQPDPPVEPPVRTPRVRNKRGRFFLGVVALLIVALVWFLWSLFQLFHGDGSGSVAVNIPRSSGVGDIANLLEKKNVISSSFFFSARTTIAGKRADLKPGRYVLRHDMSYGQVIDVLSKGPPANTVTVTIPEGRSRREIAASLKDSGLTGNYLTATKRPPPKGYGAGKATDLEGFLFPATYQLKRGVPVTQLVTKQLRAFKQRFSGVSLVKARRKNLTPYDVLIIASMVERETAVGKERPLIASVIYNRLKAGTPLGIDATTRFQFDEWSKPLTRSQLASPSPYNTRIHTGLPPGPIGNPGIASIEAAAAPASTKYMFYVSNPCKPGTHTFTRTLAEFNAAAARYDQARRKAGGNAPKGC